MSYLHSWAYFFLLVLAVPEHLVTYCANLAYLKTRKLHRRLGAALGGGGVQNPLFQTLLPQNGSPVRTLSEGHTHTQNALRASNSQKQGAGPGSPFSRLPKPPRGAIFWLPRRVAMDLMLSQSRGLHSSVSCMRPSPVMCVCVCVCVCLCWGSAIAAVTWLMLVRQVEIKLYQPGNHYP